MFKHLLIVVIFLGVAMTALLEVKTTATPLDWMTSMDATRVGESKAFAGCAPTASIDDSQAIKLAVMRAQSNIARTKQIMVSGNEHSESDTKDEKYRLTVTETAEGFLRPVIVIDKQLAVIDDVSQLCVLVVETPNK